jgi:hypothetical protein
MSTRSPRAAVLIVDDTIGDAQGLANDLTEGVVGYPVTPSEVNRDRLLAADLILVDYELSDWDDRDKIHPLALRPKNGLALAAVLREHLDVGAGDKARAIALYTGHLSEIGKALPDEVRKHVLARLHNLEWIFEKDDPSAVDGIMNLVSAVQRLPATWPNSPGDGELRLRDLLSLTDQSFVGPAWQEVLDCHPPIHELSEATHSLALLRWLAHRILPYPCFLLDDNYVAARLHIEPNTLKQILEEDGAAAERLNRGTYAGILDKLLGQRWWRSGVDELVWELTEGSLSSDSLLAGLRNLTDVEIQPGPAEPVVVVDKSYRPLRVESVDGAVRVQLDDWPPYADDAWASISDCADDARLASLVWPDDQERLKQ